MGKHWFFNQFNDFMMANESVYNACSSIQENPPTLNLENDNGVPKLKIGKYEGFKRIVLNNRHSFELFYSGEEDNNQPHGNGMLVLKIKSIGNYCESRHVLAQGEFNKGNFVFGTLYMVEKYDKKLQLKVYKGEFYSFKANGLCKMFIDVSNNYYECFLQSEGEWKDGCLNGFGRYWDAFHKDVNKPLHEGEYKNGVRNGFGRKYDFDTKKLVYEGMFAYGNPTS